MTKYLSTIISIIIYNPSKNKNIIDNKRSRSKIHNYVSSQIFTMLIILSIIITLYSLFINKDNIYNDIILTIKKIYEQYT